MIFHASLVQSPNPFVKKHCDICVVIFIILLIAKPYNMNRKMKERR